MERGLPVTRVISRMSLQQILARAVGEDVVINESNVINFEDNGDKVISCQLVGGCVLIFIF